MNELQKTILEIYSCFEDICSRHGFRFFAIGGTAIGTARHQGFIPWDDDLDVAMPIEDFKQFVQCAPSELPPWYSLVTPRDRPHYSYIFIKIEDTRTTCIEKKYTRGNLIDCYTGVWIDIMPMAGVPNPGIDRLRFLARISSCAMNNQALRLPASSLVRARAKIRGLMKAPLYGRIEKHYYSDKWLELLEQHGFDEEDYTGYTWSTPSKRWLPATVSRDIFKHTSQEGTAAGRKLENLIFPKKWFAEYVDMPFESTMMRMPSAWDEYLTAQFGDYMKPPKATQQETHSCFVDLSHPVEEYRAGIRDIPESYWD